MRLPRYSGQFKRDVKLADQRGKDLTKLRDVMELLLADGSLPRELNDHPLKGEWKLNRDLHIEPDWLLIYCAEGETIGFERTGTHSDLFSR